MKIRTMCYAKDTFLLKEFGVKGIRFEQEKKPVRFICACGCVHNDTETGVCPDCGNSEYKTVYRRAYYSPPVISLDTEHFYSHSDDPVAIPIGSIFFKVLHMNANSFSNTFEFTSDYTDLIEVSDNGIRLSNRASFNMTNLLDLIEEKKDDLFSAKQLSLFENAKVMMDKWGVTPPLDPKMIGSENHIRILSDFMGFQNLQENVEFAIPKSEVWEYRQLVWNAYKSNVIKGTVSIDDVIKKMKFLKFMKPYYRYDISGYNTEFSSCSYFVNHDFDEEKLFFLLKNSLLYAVQHGQVNHTEAVRIANAVYKWPVEKQQAFLEFFPGHITAFPGEVVYTFETVWNSYNSMAIKPPKLDVKSVSFAETINWMEKRGISAERATAFADIFERDPLAALTLMKERKKLSAEEQALIASVK